MSNRDQSTADTSYGAEGWRGKVRGTVVPGAGRGRVLGFPTANVAPDALVSVPESGVYSGWMARMGAGTLHPATVSVGTNPTFTDEKVVHIEVYCHDLDEQLYGERVAVWLVARIRGTVKFSTVEDLVTAAVRDVEIATATLTAGQRARAMAELRACSSQHTQ